MNIIKLYFQKICEPLDGFLWHRDISHPIVRPVLRDEILASGFFILIGACAYAVFPWLFWFGAGFACMAWVVWSWARFFLRQPAHGVNAAGALMRFLARYGLLAVGLYFALAIFHAPPSGLLAGLICGVALALLGFALRLRQSS